VAARPPGQVYDVRAVLLSELEERVVAGRHDVFTRAGLGPTVRRVYQVLRSDEAPVVVAERAGLPVARVVVALRRLRNHLLAKARTGLWRRPVRDQRSRAARRLGTDGVLARRVRRHEWERELWGWWQNHLTRKAGRSGKNRAGPGQTLIFRVTDEHGGPEAYPAYPVHADGHADHRTAWRYVIAGLLQQLRDTELAA
jgi:hypothetical protein